MAPCRLPGRAHPAARVLRQRRPPDSHRTGGRRVRDRGYSRGCAYPPRKGSRRPVAPPRDTDRKMADGRLASTAVPGSLRRAFRRGARGLYLANVSEPRPHATRAIAAAAEEAGQLKASLRARRGALPGSSQAVLVAVRSPCAPIPGAETMRPSRRWQPPWILTVRIAAPESPGTCAESVPARP